ncbi:MAG: type II secretion system minor pseudopilin GspK [Gammaproteobacteria bacterium]
MLGRFKHWQRKQRGLAILMALLVMSLASMLAVSLASNQLIFYRRTKNILYYEQAYQYMLGAEDWGKQILARDLSDNKTDSFQDIWAKVLPPIPVDGGSVGGSIEDLQGRFNINNLADPSDKASLDAFRELLRINKLSPDLANAVLDWLDADQQTRFPDGAEDVDYMQRERAYRADNGLMGSVSELLYIKGFDYKTYAALAPALVALPTTGTQVNVNTASPLVLRMLIKGLSEANAEQLAKELAKKPVSNIKDFLADSLIKGKPVSTSAIDVSSNYFMIHAYAKIGSSDNSASDVRATLDSMIHRVSDKDVKTLQRSQGGM